MPRQGCSNLTSALFAENSSMTDHGAQLPIHFAFLERHHRHWNEANEGLPRPKLPCLLVRGGARGTEGEGYCSFRTVNRGVLVYDLGRRKATGLPFEY